MTFNDLNLISPILKALEAQGYTKPTPIQAQAIPLILQKRDVLGVAQTGTGKTAAFAIPIIQLLTQNKTKLGLTANSKSQIKCLILTPTRELATQIDDNFQSYGQHLDLTTKVIFGGVSDKAQIAALRTGIEVVIATPGRLLDLIGQNLVDLSHLEFFVLDEADRMLDMGFVHDVKKIITHLPKVKQNLFFSATMPLAIVELSRSILIDPVKIEVTPVSSTAEIIDQVVYFVDKGNKKHLLIEILKDQTIERALVFARTKHGSDKVVKDLLQSGIKAEAIHGNKSQNNRQRALENFKSKATRILVATDIAARGIDIDELTHVFNYELPNIPESYVHRIGRTGRAGSSGIAIAFCDVDEKEYLADIQKLIGKKIPVISEHDFPLVNNIPTKPAAKPKLFSRKGARIPQSQPANQARVPNPRGFSPVKPASTLSRKPFFERRGGTGK